MTDRESAEKIVSQNGECRGIVCSECVNLLYGCDNQKGVLESAKQWLKDNPKEKKVTTNEHIENFVRDIKMLNDKELEAVANGVIKLLEAIDKPEKPQIGDRCIFWDDDKEEYCTGTLERYSPYWHECWTSRGVSWWKHCKKLTRDAK